MADAIVVLNAGSSSLKFSVFVARDGGLEPELRGNIEELDTGRASSRRTAQATCGPRSRGARGPGSVDRVPGLGTRAAYFKQRIRNKLIEHKHYVAEHGEDMPEISGWQWGQAGPPGKADRLHRGR